MAMGRPSIFTEELATEICLRMASGQSLREVCRDDAMPAKSTVLKWVLQKKDFADQYALARELLMEHWADEIMDIADDGANDWYERQNKNGETVTVPNSEHINRSRLRVDTRKWLMSKLAPNRYGDRLHAELTGKDGKDLNPEATPMESVRRVAFLFREVARQDDEATH